MKTKFSAFLGLILATTFSQAHETELETYTITPDDTNIEGITYARSLQLLEKERHVKYGEPIGIVINKEEGSVDIFNVDDIVIRVPLEELQSQPNRVGPDIFKQK